MRFVVIRDCLSVEELANVVRVISSSLKPEREIVVIEALRNKFWVAAIRRIDIGDICIILTVVRRN